MSETTPGLLFSADFLSRDDLLTRAAGKIFKRLLREPYWRKAGRAI